MSQSLGAEAYQDVEPYPLDVLGTESKTTPIKLLNLAMLAVFIAWLVTACYALSYLISH